MVRAAVETLWRLWQLGAVSVETAVETLDPESVEIFRGLHCLRQKTRRRAQFTNLFVPDPDPPNI